MSHPCRLTRTRAGLTQHTHVGLTQHPYTLNAARPRKVSTRFRPFWLLRETQRGVGFGRAAELNSLPKESAGPAVWLADPLKAQRISQPITLGVREIGRYS